MTRCDRAAATRPVALIVEDDALLRTALAAQLEALGLAARCASDRPAALAQAAGCLFALIDLGLPPDPDSPAEGLALIETLVTLWPQMPLIVLTGQDEQASALAAIERGAFDFLAKPASGAAIEQAIARARRFAEARRRLAASGVAALQLTTHELAQGLREATSLAQEKLVRSVLEACGHNASEAARRLGIARPRLYYYLDKFGIRRPDDDAR